jgi:hypothetical protein
VAGEEMKTDKITTAPTKRLFIDILTKDISVKDCILDLIDNAVDSYIWNGIEDKREIRLNISKDQFEISDTCGGIDRDFLKTAVFRFGADVVRNKPTLGIYGIGMKRAMLKMGKTIVMETDNGRNYCKILWNVDEWSRSDEDWDIPFEYGNSRLTLDEKGYTKIVVKDLYEAIKNRFDLDSFINEIAASIRLTYTFFIEKNNIDFNVNNAAITEPYLGSVRVQYNPTKFKGSYNGVEFEIICFIDPFEGKRREKELGKRGWNIFCNKRLILAEDTTETTGWTGKRSELPKYHPIYNEFRGLVFIQSEDPSKLPLNTSKTGLDIDSPTYEYIRNKMIQTARPFITHFSQKYTEDKTTLDEIDNKIQRREVGTDEEDSTIQVKHVRLDEIADNSVFIPIEKPKPAIKMAKICFKRPKKMIEKVKKYLGVRTNEEVGEETFDYFVELEEIEDE